MKDGVEFPLGLGCDVMIEVLILVGDVFVEVDLTWVDCTGEYAVAVVEDDVTLVVGLYDGEEEHVLDVSRRHHSPTLAGGSQGPKTDLLIAFCTDYSFCFLWILEKGWLGDVGAEAMPQELSDQSYLAIPICRSVPDVGHTLSMTLAVGPFAGKRPLIPLVYHFVAFDH